ncbi:MAG: helix-turn-helix domain-containing protein [Spirochaetota bacterium]
MVDAQLAKIARAIKSHRRALGMSLEELSTRAGVSRSLLSKVENSRAIPSMSVIIMIARGLHLTLSELVSGTEAPDDREYVVVRASEHVPVEKEDATGFRYESLIARELGDSLFEVSILTVEPNAKRSLVRSDGYEFIYVLDGELDYQLGNETVALTQGDSIFFDGQIDHVPVNTSEAPARILVCYVIYPSE